MLGFVGWAHTGGMMTFLVFWVLMQAHAGGPGPGSPTDALNVLDERFVADLHDKKIEDVLTLYTADAVFVNPDGTEATGPGLRKLYEKVTAAYDSALHLKRVSLKRDINTMIEDGTYTEELVHRDSGKVDHLMGTYRFTMHLAPGGKWLFTRMEWH